MSYQPYQFPPPMMGAPFGFGMPMMGPPRPFGMGMPAPFPMYPQGPMPMPMPFQNTPMQPMSAAPMMFPGQLPFPSAVSSAPSYANNPMYQSAAVSPVARPPPVQPSLYASMMNLPTPSLYASAMSTPSIYASTPGLGAPFAPMAPLVTSAKPTIPTLTEGASTVGLMLWPGKTGDLIITGIKEDTSAAETDLKIGDTIVNVDGESVENMDATDVASMMAGPTGSTLTITTGSGVTCTVTRDVSAAEANATTVKSINQSGSGASGASGRQLSQVECQQFGVPAGSVWGETKPKASSARPSPSKTPTKTPTKSAALADQDRLLTHAECSRYGVPYGSRMGPIKKKAAPKEVPVEEGDDGHLL